MDTVDLFNGQIGHILEVLWFYGPPSCDTGPMYLNVVKIYSVHCADLLDVQNILSADTVVSPGKLKVIQWVSQCYAIKCYMFSVFLTRVSRCPISLRSEHPIFLISIEYQNKSPGCIILYFSDSLTFRMNIFSFLVLRSKPNFPPSSACFWLDLRVDNEHREDNKFRLWSQP
jgi:hypothetical protein